MKTSILFIYEKLKNWPIYWLKAIKVMLIVTIPMSILIFYITRPIPTLIQARLVTERVTFKVNQDTFLEPMAFEEISIGKGFVEAALRFKNGETWQIEKAPNELYPEMQVEVANPTTLGTLSRIEIKAGTEVTLEFKEEGEQKQLNLELFTQNHIAQFINLSCGNSALKVSVRHCKIGQEVYGFKNFSIEMLSPRRPFIEVKWQGKIRRLLLTLNSNSKFNILAKPLSAYGLKFLTEKLENGERILNPVIKQGTISYPQLHKDTSIEIKHSSLIFFDEQDQFSLEKIVFNPKVNGIEMHLSGKAKGSLSTIPIGLVNSEYEESARHDYRLTHWDIWVEGNLFQKILINMMSWLFPIVIGLVAIVKVEVTPRKKK